MKTNYARNLMLDARYGDGAFAKPATVYVALFTAAPSVVGGGTEVSGGSYARVAMTNDAANFPDAVAGMKANGVVVIFPQATASWGVVTHFGFFDSLVGGNLLDYAPLTSGGVAAPKTIQSGDTPQFSIGAFQFTET